MRRREKGEKRNKNGSPIDQGVLSAEEVDRLLRQSNIEKGPSPLEKARELSNAVDSSAEAFHRGTGISAEVRAEATSDEVTDLEDIDRQVDTSAAVAKKDIQEVAKDGWGRQPKKASSATTHFERATGKPIYSGAPKKEVPIISKRETTAEKAEEVPVIPTTDEVPAENPTPDSKEKSADQIEADAQEMMEEEKIRTLINGARTLEELTSIISANDIKLKTSSGEVWDADQINKSITTMLEGSRPPRAAGLRERAFKLAAVQYPDVPYFREQVEKDGGVTIEAPKAEIPSTPENPDPTAKVAGEGTNTETADVSSEESGGEKFKVEVPAWIIEEIKSTGEFGGLITAVQLESGDQEAATRTFNWLERVIDTEESRAVHRDERETAMARLEKLNKMRDEIQRAIIEAHDKKIFENFEVPGGRTDETVESKGETTVEDEKKATVELTETAEFKEFFANLSLDDFKNTKKLKEKFDSLISEDLVKKLGWNEGVREQLMNKYFTDFCQQAELVFKMHIAKASTPESGLKKEGKKLIKGVFGGGSYALANRAVMFGARTLSAPALAIKLAAGGVTGAAVSGFNYMLGRGYEKLTAKSMEKLAKRAEKLKGQGLDEVAIAEQLKGDLSALMIFDQTQADRIDRQRSKISGLQDEELDQIFTGEDTGQKKKKAGDIERLMDLSVASMLEEGKDKATTAKERQELIKSLTENNALEEYITHQIESQLKEMAGDRELTENEISNLTLQAQLMVQREMNSILGDVMAQEKFDEIDESSKGSFGKSYVGKLFGKTPPESLMQALGKGFVSGSVAGAAYSDAIAGAVYMGLQRLQGSLRAELLKHSESEVKTTNEILDQLTKFNLTTETFNQAEDLIREARARIKLPDIKEAERAKIELEIDDLQKKMLVHAQINRLVMDNSIEVSKLAAMIVHERDSQISQAAEIAGREKKRKGISGLWKTFRQLSGKEKLKVLGRAGFEGVKGGAYGAIGAELVSAGSAAMDGADYDISQGIDNVVNRATLNAAGVAVKLESMLHDEPDQTPTGDTTRAKQEDLVDQESAPQDTTIKSTTTDSTASEEVDPATLAHENELTEITNKIGQAIIEGDHQTADILAKDSTLDTTTVDQLKNLATVEQKVGVNSFENGLTTDALDKIVCELDNDPASKEAADSRQALEYLIQKGDVSLEQYQKAIADHIGEEMHLGNEDIVKNAIENSRIDILTVVETQARVQAEQELGINTFDGEVTDEELAKIAEQAKGGNSEFATGILEELHEAGKISDEQLFSIEHASVGKAGFKEVEQAVDQDQTKEAKHNLTLELGQDGAPKHLEQLFYRVGIDAMEFGKDGVTNVEAAQILNVGANLRVLSEGHDIAGLTAEDFEKYVTIEDGKVTINDYEGFQEHIVDPLVEHAGSIITEDNVADTGAVAYIDNIKGETWGDMLSPEGVEADGIHLDQGEIDAAEERIFQHTLESSELGELATEVHFDDEDNGSFNVDGQDVVVHENQVVRIGHTDLEAPIKLGDKDSGGRLVDQVSEVKAKEFMSFVDRNQAEMMARLNEQLSNHELSKQEIIPPVLPTPEYDISTELKSTLDRLGFGKGQGREEWEFLKAKHVDDLLNKHIEGHSGRPDFLEGRHRAHMREFFQHAINEGELRPPKAGGPETIGEAMKELMIKETREKLVQDIDMAEKKVAVAEAIAEKQTPRSETLGDQIRETIGKHTEDSSQAEEIKADEKSEGAQIPGIPEWLTPEQKAEMDQMMPAGWKENDIPMYMRPDEGRQNFDDKVVESTDEAIPEQTSADYLTPVEVPQGLDLSHVSPDVTIIGREDMEMVYLKNHMEINEMIKQLGEMREKHGDDKDFTSFEADVAEDIKDLQQQNQEIEDIASGKIDHGSYRYQVTYDATDPSNVSKFAEAKMSGIAVPYNLSSDSSDKMEAAMAKLDDAVAELEQHRAEEEGVNISASEFYQGLFNEKLNVDGIDKMDATELQVMKMRLEAVNDTLKEGPPPGTDLKQTEIDRVLKENTEILAKVEKQITEKSK